MCICIKMNLEIERRFLFDILPAEAPVKAYEIEQAYLNRKPVLRIRRKVRINITAAGTENTSGASDAGTAQESAAADTSYECTYKGRRTGAIGKEEVNLPLNAEAYEHLRSKADGIILHKTRYVYDLGGGLQAEADVFGPPYEDLKIVEVEFDSEEAAASFAPPDWFGEEITGVKRYSNASLAYEQDNAEYRHL